MNIRRRITVALTLIVGMAIVGVIGYRILGGPSVRLLDAIYMVVVTLSGVGYAEIVDTSHNPALRIFNMFIVVFGVAIAVYVFSVLTASIIEGHIHDVFRRRRMKKRISALSKHFIVCGLGETGRNTVEELIKTETPHVIIESSQDVVDRLRNQSPEIYSHILFIIGDATDESVLREAGIERARGIVSTLDSDKDNLVITVLVRQQNPHIRIISRYTDNSFADRMVKAGANAAVSPNRIGGLRLASELLRPEVVSFLDLMIQYRPGTIRIEEIPVEHGSRWLGRSISGLALRSNYGLVLLAIKTPNTSETEEDPFRINPPDDLILEEGTTIIVMGEQDSLHRARKSALSP